MLLATKLGSAAADFIAEGRFGNLIGIRDGRVAGIPLSSIIDRVKPIPLDDDMLAAGRSLGICFGD
jgi:6-phosphofructokinase 1